MSFEYILEWYVIPGTASSVSDTNYIQNSFNVFNIIEKEKY
jgi:hypothetical protein